MATVAFQTMGPLLAAKKPRRRIAACRDAGKFLINSLPYLARRRRMGRPVPRRPTVPSATGKSRSKRSNSLLSLGRAQAEDRPAGPVIAVD